MKLSRIEIQNFKGYRGNVVLNLSHDLNYLAGENNVGKSTLFEAVTYVRDGGKDLDNELRNNFSNENDEVFVQITFSGMDLEKSIDAFVPKKSDALKEYIDKSQRIPTLILKRSSKPGVWMSKNKEKSIDPGTLTLYNPNNNVWENPSGIDAPLKNLFQVIWIEADGSAADEVSLKSSGIIGKILDVISDEFKNTNEYKAYEQAHDIAFSQLQSLVAPEIDDKLTEILQDQYGQGIKTRLNFSSPNIKSLMLNASLLVDDGAETEFYDKGHGLQRSVALALIQLQADRLQKTETVDDEQVKQLVIYFIDEPEVYLHPRGQRKLRDALVALSERHQVIIATHSPYMLDAYNDQNQEIFVLQKHANTVNFVNQNARLGNLGVSPTTAEITYVAYDIPTYEFANQLFEKLTQEYGKSKIIDVDKKFIEHANNPTKKKWTHNNTEYNALISYVRNYYHHAGSTDNVAPTEVEIKQAIDEMISEIQLLKSES